MKQFEPSFRLPPTSLRDKLKTVLRWIFPLTFIAKLVQSLFQTLLGRFLGSKILVKPLRNLPEKGKLLPNLTSHIAWEKICNDAVRQNEDHQWGYIPTDLQNNLHIQHKALRTHDRALIEHSCVGAKNLFNKTMLWDPDTKVVCFFPGRGQDYFPMLPWMTLAAQDMGCVFASLNHRGVGFSPKSNIQQGPEWTAYYRELLGLYKQAPEKMVLRVAQQLRKKSANKASHMVNDGMALVGHYLQQGIKPKNITLWGYSMGGVGLMVAARYKQIFKKFTQKGWEKNQKLVDYGQWLFGAQNPESLKVLIAEYQRDTFEFNVIADRTYTSFSRAVVGRIRTALDNHPRLAKIVFYIMWPIVKFIQVLCKWELDIIKAFKKLHHKLKISVTVSGGDNQPVDSKIHPKSAALHKKLHEQGHFESDVHYEQGHMYPNITHPDNSPDILSKWAHVAMPPVLFMKDGTRFTQYVKEFVEQCDKERASAKLS